ncbi:MAG: DUF1559 domain-containing protein [Gemmatales bacterium]
MMTNNRHVDQCRYYYPLPRYGFTLVELLLVIGIIGLLLALAFPAIQRVRGISDKVECANNMRQITHAIHQYHHDYYKMPPARGIGNKRTGQANDLYSSLSWRAHLLPYFEQDALWTKATQACLIQRLSYLPPHTGYGTPVKILGCPSDGRISSAHIFEGILTAFSSYLGVQGSDASNGMYATLPDGDGIPFSTVTDGLSFTLLFGERPPPFELNAGQWYSNYIHGSSPLLCGPDTELRMVQYPYTISDPCKGPFRFSTGSIYNPCDRFHFWSLHPLGANFAFADASVRFVKYSTDQKTLLRLASRNGGEAVELPD